MPKYKRSSIICKKCGKEYPATLEYFRKNRHGNPSSPCKVCDNIAKRKWDSKNPDKVKKHKADSNKKNRAHITEYHRQWKLVNPDSVQASYDKRDKEAAKDRAAAWYAENKEHALKRQSDKYYGDEAYRKKVKASKRAYGKTHRSPNRRITVIRYRARKRSLPDTFTMDDWNDCLHYFGAVCVYCGKEDVPLAADHFIPLSAIGCPGTVPTNMICACMSCNSSKNNRDPYKWTQRLFPATFGGILYKIERYFASL